MPLNDPPEKKRKTLNPPVSDSPFLVPAFRLPSSVLPSSRFYNVSSSKLGPLQSKVVDDDDEVDDMAKRNVGMVNGGRVRMRVEKANGGRDALKVALAKLTSEVRVADQLMIMRS